MHRHISAALILGAVLLQAPAHSQVIRCTDPATGKVTYTDGDCAKGASTREVEPRKTPEELQRERQQTAEALERKQQQQQADAQAADAQARQAAEWARARAHAPVDYARTPECLRSRRELEYVTSTTSAGVYEHQLRLEAAQRQVDLDCLGPQAYAELEKARAAQPKVIMVPPRTYPAPAPPAPRYLTQCGEWRCTDNQGNSYPKTGPGRFPGQGGVCRSNGGGQAPC